MRQSIVIPFLALACCLALAPAASGRIDTKRYAELREDERYQMDVAEKLFDQRKWESAQNEYQKFLEVHLKSTGASYAMYMVAVCGENRSMVNQAIKGYKDLGTYFPDSPEAPLAAYSIGRCHRKTGESEAAVQQYLQVVSQFPKAPISGDALWDASEIQLTRNLYDKTVELRRRLVDSVPQSARFNQAVDWLVEHYLFKENSLDAARSVCRLRRSAIESERHIAQLQYDRGYWLYHNQKKTEDARKMMDTAVELYGNVIVQAGAQKTVIRDALGMIAQCYRHSGRPEKAYDAFEKLLHEYPEADDWRQQYGSCLEEYKQWATARMQYTQFKDRGRGAYQVAESYHRERNVPEAEAAYMRVVTDYPDRSKPCLYRVGNLHQYVGGNYDKAINAYRQSEYNPPEYLFRIAECFDSWKNYDMAIKTYQEIIGFFKPSASEALWRVALCFEKRKEQGDTENAIAAMKRLCDVYPGSSQSSQAHQRLESKYKIHYTGGGMKKEQTKE